MYFFYADESGDAGEFDPTKPDKTGSPYLIYSGIIVHDVHWKLALQQLKTFRKRIAKEGLLQYDQEFHCAEMVDPRKTGVYAQLSVAERWKLIEQFCFIIGSETKSKVIAVVLNKESSEISPSNYITEIITKLYQAFNHFLKDRGECGIVFFDRANEKKISGHVRKLLRAGGSGQYIDCERMDFIVEDPIYKVSSDSIFVQSADAVAYTIKEKEFPKPARKKFDADLIFKRKLLKNCYVSHVSDADGIIRI